MDRRGFLKTGGAAAVAAGSIAAPAASAKAPPAIRPDARPLTLAVQWGGEVPGSAAERLAQRIETATGGRYRIAVGAAEADADLTYGRADAALRHPAFAILAGLPLGQGLDAASHMAWLAAGGGQMLWDELAAGFGFKPLAAGRTAPSPGVWASQRLEARSDLQGAGVAVEGVAAQVMRRLGAEPMTLAPHALGAALADGRLAAAEWLGPLPVASPDLQPLAGRLYRPGFHAAGALLALTIDRTVWDSLDAADQAIFEACAAQAYHAALAEAQAEAMLAAQIEAPAKWPVRQAWSPELSAALADAMADVAAQIASTDEAARRIHASHEAFRGMLGEPATA